jgi:uncharacterized protein YajQ (UPF0234 family)
VNQQLNNYKDRLEFVMAAYNFDRLSNMDRQQVKSTLSNADKQLRLRYTVQPRFRQVTSFVCMQ